MLIGHICVQIPGFVQQNNSSHVFKQELVFFYYTLNLLSFTAIVFNLPFLRVHEQANICKTTLKKN